jgi:hypothetical protein
MSGSLKIVPHILKHGRVHHPRHPKPCTLLISVKRAEIIEEVIQQLLGCMSSIPSVGETTDKLLGRAIRFDDMLSVVAA